MGQMYARIPLVLMRVEQIGVRQGAERQLRDGRAAALQHLAEGRLRRRPRALVVPRDQEAMLVEMRHPQMLAREILEEALEVQLVKAMNVQVHQPRHDHQVGAVDGGVRPAAIVGADEGDLVAGKHDVAVANVFMTARLRIPGHHPVGVLDPRCRSHLLHTRSISDIPASPRRAALSHGQAEG